MKARKEFNKVVNYNKETNEITVLDDVFSGVFSYNDGFYGATGTTFLPVSKAEYKERTKKANVIEKILEVGVPELFQLTGANGCYKAMKENGEIESFMFDTSYSELWKYLRKELKLNKTNAYIFECTGGGRCFDNNFNGNVNPELSEIIRKFETENNIEQINNFFDNSENV